MNITIERDALYGPLQGLLGVVDRKHKLPVLGNVLVSVDDDGMLLTATDTEVELRTRTNFESADAGEVTLPARKMADICRHLPTGTAITVSVSGGKANMKAGRSRFSLATLAASDFPSFDQLEFAHRLAMPQRELKRLLDMTAFAMAQQDVRYSLNGLLSEVGADYLRTVATDGHRLALAELPLKEGGSDAPRTVIVPRKGVLELQRLLQASDDEVVLQFADGGVRAEVGDTTLTTKLIDGKFPDYTRVVPKVEDCDKLAIVDRETLRQGLTRAAILSNEKFRAVRVALNGETMQLSASNPDQEEAEEELSVDFTGDSLEIGFNVAYLIEVLSNLDAEQARLHLKDSNSSCLIMGDSDACRYVVMPMRL